MKKVDRLIMKAQASQRSGILQVSACLVEPVGSGWQAIVNLWDGVAAPNGRTDRIVLDAGTQDEAIAAVEKMQSERAPAGYRSKDRGAVVLIGSVMD